MNSTTQTPPHPPGQTGPTAAPPSAVVGLGPAPPSRPSPERNRWKLSSKGRHRLLVYSLLVMGSLLMLAPFFWMVSNSLKTEAEAMQAPPALLPEQPRWENYPSAMRKMNFANAAANTIVVTFCCIVGQVISSSLVGFGFARFRFRGRGPLFAVMMATMLLPPQVTMIPLFLLFRMAGLIDTLLPLIIPAMLGQPFFIFMFRQFFAQIPEGLLEAARIDGASHWTIYWRIMLPLSQPVIAIVAIYTFMQTWNDFLSPLIYLNSPEKETLALALNSFNSEYGVRNANELMAASFLTMLPCLAIFFAAQRYFVQSVTGTGLKE
ncbi:carbohydrate ABC transporter permease [Phycisphaerales bacterium AB-hyl4]|uniref:Carbohydrate ABC transporter permease n=1 Tax=Natronomicrosphaera hydrolytica TaxID=3242702 RepID=A0ABV4U4R7_9BACT